MSIKIKFAATTFAALALGAVVTLASSAALANTKGPSAPQHHRAPGGQAGQPNDQRPHYDPHHQHNGSHGSKQVCYWLPKIGGGTVTGLEQKCYWAKS